MRFIKSLVIFGTVMSFFGYANAAEKYCHYKVKGGKTGDLLISTLDDVYTYNLDPISCMKTAINALFRDRTASAKPIRSYGNTRASYKPEVNAALVKITFSNTPETFNEAVLDSFVEKNPNVTMDGHDFDGKEFTVTFLKNLNSSIVAKH